MDKAFARKLLQKQAGEPENIEIYRAQLLAFRRKFGREMGPRDPFFFDPDADTPRFRPPENADYALDFLAEMMAETGVNGEAVYAFIKTRGLFPSSPGALSPAEQAEWDAAIREYHRGLRRGASQ